MIDRQAGVAQWAQIASVLRKEIDENHRVGDWLASESALASKFGVNRLTLRRAVEALIDDGMLERLHGRGVRVTGSQLIYDIDRRTKFTQRVEESGRIGATEILFRKEDIAVGPVARKLNLDEGQPVFRIETLRFLDDMPLCLITHFLSGPAAEIGREKYHAGSLHTCLEQEGPIKLERIESMISTRAPTDEDARFLRMPRRIFVLRVKGVNADEASGRPLEYSVTRFRGDRIELSLTFPQKNSCRGDGRL